eukprot:941256-Alexandrium_andersonii.AAC.1
MLASPAAREIASNRAQCSSECLAPTVGRCVRTRARCRRPAARPCSSRSSRVRFAGRGAGAA